MSVPTSSEQLKSASHFQSLLHPEATSSGFVPAGLRSITSHTDHSPLVDTQIPASRPEFSPYFTIITDPSSNTTYHPSRVHYLFSDDDPDILSNACIQVLSGSSNIGYVEDATQLPQLPMSTGSSSPQQLSRRTTTGSFSSERDERIVILDMNETGDGVVKARSLNQTWQLLKTEVGNAPTWAGAEEVDGDQTGGKGMMLRIEGTGLSLGGADSDTEKNPAPGTSDNSGKVPGSDLAFQTLMDNFDRKMAVLRKVTEACEDPTTDTLGHPLA